MAIAGAKKNAATFPLPARGPISHTTRVQDLRDFKGKLLLILGLGLLVLVWQSLERGKLVVYCAHDSVFSEAVLRDFEKQTGIAVTVKFDTEATKSLGLVEQIIREEKNPRCDVFWNNELLGTLDLAERGLLDPHKGAGWTRMPERFRDADGRWAGFAARLRVTIHRAGTTWTNDALNDDLTRFALAKPLYGTTLTHYTALWSLWGGDRTKAWHHGTREHGLVEVNGNAAVKDIVAGGRCDAGWTDTDDYFAAKDAGAAVTATPVRLENGATICIPNTVAIIRGTKRPADARRLADFLLSARTELALAKSRSRQIPLGPLDEAGAAQIPDEVRALMPAAAGGLPLSGLLKARNECLEWLKDEYLR